MKNNRNYGYLLCVLVVGVVGTIGFIGMGYWTAGAIDYMEKEGMDFISAFLTVLSRPFDKYVNDLTPVTMLIGFILFAGLFFFFLRHTGDYSETGEEMVLEPDVMDIPEISDKDLFESALKEQDMEEVSFGKKEYVRPSELEKEPDAEEKIPTEHVEENVSFSDDIVTELLCDYTLSQISAMLKIKPYMDIKDATILKRMFKPSMSADDIVSYIEMFYGENGERIINE